jgi:disulfide bond formation protein DsbB
MNRNTLVLAAAGGSAALLLGALAFQYLGGLYPCPLCLWQRWPHLAAVLIGLAALALPGRALPVLGALAALATAGIGGFHAGVELGWWQGLDSCAGAGIGGLTGAALLDPTANIPPPVRCDAVAWSFLGLSMAAWNMILSLGLAALWLAAARKAA